MNKKNTYIILLCALALRLSYLVLFVDDTSDLYMPDSQIYVELAKFISAGETDTARFKQLDSERVPIYSLFMASVYSIFGQNNWYVVILQLIIDCFTCLIIALTAGLINQRLYLAAGLLAAINLNIIVHGAMILTDTFFLLPFSLMLFFLTRYIKLGKNTDLVLLGLFFAIAMLTRSVLLYALPILVLVVILRQFIFDTRFNLTKFVSSLIIVVSIVTALLLPRYFANKSNYDHFTLVSQAGTHALNWVVPLAKEQSIGISFVDAQKQTLGNYQNYLAKTGQREPENIFAKSELQKKYAFSELMDLGWYNITKAWLIGSLTNTFVPSSHAMPVVAKMERPSFYETQGQSFFEKLINYFSNTASLNYVAIILISLLITICFLGLACFGCFSVFSNRFNLTNPVVRFTASIYLLFITYFYVVTGPIIGVKYRLPIEPMLIIFTAGGLVMFMQLVHKKNRDLICAE